jgi:hypothetical protein
LGANDLTLTNYTTGNNILIPASAKIPGQAEWRFPTLSLDAGYYQVTLRAEGVEDSDGNLLDGNGDQVPGDSWQRVVLVAAVGDVNSDGLVDTLDYNRIRHAPSVGTWSNGDLDGNGTVDADDIAVWKAVRFTDVRPPRRSSGRSPRSAIATIRAVMVPTRLEARERVWRRAGNQGARCGADIGNLPTELPPNLIDWVFGRDAI